MLNEQTVEQLSSMRLAGMLEAFKEQMTSTRYGKLSFEERFSMMVEKEWELREERALKRRLKKSRIKQQACVQDIDYRHARGLDRSLMRSLASCRFIKDGHNVIITGPTGVGKTHLAIALGVKACEARRRVLFTQALPLMDELLACVVDRSIGTRLAVLGRLDLLIVDELGYMPMDRQRANLFFQLVSRCYEKGSIIVTSNKPFDQWGEVFGDDVIASAILDRLLHHSYIIAINGPSYRTREKMEHLVLEQSSGRAYSQ